MQKINKPFNPSLQIRTKLKHHTQTRHDANLNEIYNSENMSMSKSPSVTGSPM